MIRFEILLPLFYNDGRPFEPEKFLATDDEIVQVFRATARTMSQCMGNGNTRASSIPIS
jgi:hypothetical protein